MIQDKKEGGQLWLCHDHQTLCDFFWGRYTHAHFLSVWTFIAPFIDLPNSSPLATYYCQSVYANVCARAKLHNDWLTNTASEDRPNSRMQHSTGGINAYLKEFPTAPQFENISRGEFKEMDSLRIGKNRTKVEAYVVTPKDRHFVQAPPPPSVTYERSAFGSAPVGTPGAAAGTPVADAGSAGGRFNSPAVTVDTPFTEEMIERGRRRQRGLARGGGGGGRGRRGGEGAGMIPN